MCYHTVKKWNNMYTVEFYEDKNGISEVCDYFMKLSKESETNKNAQINKNKIFSYVRALEEYGTRIGKPIVLYKEISKSTENCIAEGKGTD